MISAKQMEQIIEVLRSAGYDLPNPMNVANYGVAWSEALQQFHFEVMNTVAFEWIQKADHFPTLTEFRREIEAYQYRCSQVAGVCRTCDGLHFVEAGPAQLMGCPDCNPMPSINLPSKRVEGVPMPLGFAKAIKGLPSAK
jgi:hypothetical protein